MRGPITDPHHNVHTAAPLPTTPGPRRSARTDLVPMTSSITSEGEPRLGSPVTQTQTLLSTPL